MNEFVKPNPHVHLTDGARAKIRDLMLESGTGPQAVRIYAEMAGCAGPECGLSFDSAGPGDLVVETAGLTLVVDADSARVLSGVQIDYVDTAERNGFIFSLPRAEDRCGCAS